MEECFSHLVDAMFLAVFVFLAIHGIFTGTTIYEGTSKKFRIQKFNNRYLHRQSHWE